MLIAAITRTGTGDTARGIVRATNVTTTSIFAFGLPHTTRIPRVTARTDVKPPPSPATILSLSRRHPLELVQLMLLTIRLCLLTQGQRIQ